MDCFRAMVAVQEKFSAAKTKSSQRGGTHALGGDADTAGSGAPEDHTAPAVVETSERKRWYGYYVSKVVPGAVKFELQVRCPGLWSCTWAVTG